MPFEITCDVLLTPDSAELRYLPEGPYSVASSFMCWVSIQHAADTPIGSVNLLNLKTNSNVSFTLHGRPGFAFPASRGDMFFAGIEREIGLYDTRTHHWEPLVSGIENGVENTIINDAVLFDEGLVFGCKDLEFKTPKAGLYLYRFSDKQLLQLANNQTCSNGKAVTVRDGQRQLIDIDTPTRQVVSYNLDIDAGQISERTVLVDVSSEDIFPDGMLLTPDGKSIIVAFYDPGDPEFGVARQYNIATGSVEGIWKCPQAPRVTCPQLVEIDGAVRLVLTTAIEGMPPEQFARHPNSGCLFVGETSFTTTNDQPEFRLSVK